MFEPSHALTLSRLYGARCALCLAGIVLAGCVTLPPEAIAPQGRPITPSEFPEPGPGSREEVSLHFQVRGVDPEAVREVLRLAEAAYERIMRDTGLYSFIGSRPYPVTLYADRTEYLAKTRLPEWSAGAAVGNTLYVYPSDRLEATLSHEMTHLLFYEAVGEKAGQLRWLNEGLAVYEETVASLPAAERAAFQASRSRLASSPMPFEAMIAFVPATEKERLINLWYLQVGEVVRFMVERGGRLGFSIFLRMLRDGRSLEEALREGFPGLWSDLRSLERDWRGA